MNKTVSRPDVKPGLYLPRFFGCGKTRRFHAKRNDFPLLSAICRDDAQQEKCAVELSGVVCAVNTRCGGLAKMPGVRSAEIPRFCTISRNTCCSQNGCFEADTEPKFCI